MNSIFNNQHLSYLPLEDDLQVQIVMKLICDENYRLKLEEKYNSNDLSNLSDDEITFINNFHQLEKRIKYSKYFFEYLTTYEGLSPNRNKAILEWSRSKSTLNPLLIASGYNTKVLTNKKNFYFDEEDTKNYLCGNISPAGIKILKGPKITMKSFDTIISEYDYAAAASLIHQAKKYNLKSYLGFCGEQTDENLKKQVENYHFIINYLRNLYNEDLELSHEQHHGMSYYLVKKKTKIII